MSKYSHLSTHPSIPEPKDSLVNQGDIQSEKRAELANIKALEQKLKQAQGKLYEIISKENELRGLEPAVMRTRDLTELFLQSLTNPAPISKLFEQHQHKYQLPNKWAKRVLIKKPSKDILTASIEDLKKAGHLLPMVHYNILDIKKLAKADNYRKLCREIRHYHNLANQLKDKDSQILAQKKTIESQTKQLQALQQQLLNQPHQSWQEKATEMRHKGITIKDIAHKLGKSTSTISRHLNKSGAPN
jgi:hypothetical protein